KLVFILLAIMAVQALNPLQGGIMVGLTGVICVMIPMCWFWVGQSWGSSRFAETVLFGVVVPLAVAAALFGLWQVFFGKPDYQLAWMRVWYETRSAIYSLGKDQGGSDAARPFGFFTSVSAFTKFLSVGCVLLVASAIGGRIRLLVVALPAIALSLFLASARGPIVVSCGVIVLLWAMRSRSRSGWITRAVFASVVIIAGLGWTLSEVND